jgi:hypothetical protein
MARQVGTEVARAQEEVGLWRALRGNDGRVGGGSRRAPLPLVAAEDEETEDEETGNDGAKAS